MPAEPTQSLPGLRAIVPAETRAFSGRAGYPPAGAESHGPVAHMSDLLAPGEAPVDTSRVDTIRKALESGTYPVIPTRIADAIIAAGLLLKVRA